MSKFEIGELVVLVSGSMRMGVEGVDGDQVACVWCHEGEIGRDNFDVRLLKKWEFREDHGDRGGHRGRGGDDRDDARRGGGKPYRGDRDGGGKPHRGGDRGGDRDHSDKPRGKTGWDGKPREKKYFRKED